MVTGFSIGITQNSQSVENNRSNVTVALTIAWNGGSYNATGNAAGTLTIDGIDYSFKAVFNTAQKASGSEVIYSETVDVDHSADGSKTLSCQASFNTQTMAGTVTASASKPLTQIPRESTIWATDADIGAVSAVMVDRKNAAYTHSIAYQFGNLSGYIANASGALSSSEMKLSATSIPFPVPESFYAQIPNAPSDTCALTIRTYSGSTQIGQARTCSFKATAAPDKCRPEVSGKVVDINLATLALTEDENKLVRGMSTALCTMTALPRNGAVIQSRTIGGVEVAENERTIPNIELNEVVFTATDSREYTGRDSKAVDLIPYKMLTANVTAWRVDPTSGNAVLKVEGNYFKGSFGAKDNFLRVEYRKGSSGDYQEAVPVISDDNTYTAEIFLEGLEYTKSFDYEVVVSDALNTVPRNATVKKGIPVFDWGEGDFAFHVPVSAPSLNQVFMGTTYLGGTNKLVLQSRFATFTDVGNGRQSVFLFGMDNGLLIQGVIGVNDAGVVWWSGTDGVSVTAGDGGTVVVNLPIEAWDWFTLLSAEEFSVV